MRDGVRGPHSGTRAELHGFNRMVALYLAMAQDAPLSVALYGSSGVFDHRPILCTNRMSYPVVCFIRLPRCRHLSL